MKEFTVNELLVARINRIEVLVSIYGDRDDIRLEQLLKELDALNMQLLDEMVA